MTEAINTKGLDPQKVAQDCYILFKGFSAGKYIDMAAKEMGSMDEETKKDPSLFLYTAPLDLVQIMESDKNIDSVFSKLDFPNDKIKKRYVFSVRKALAQAVIAAALAKIGFENEIMEDHYSYAHKNALAQRFLGNSEKWVIEYDNKCSKIKIDRERITDVSRIIPLPGRGGK